MIIPAALLLLLIAAIPAQAHVPIIPEKNLGISSAAYISDPEKSWAIYGELGQDSPQYYSFYMKKDQRIYLSLLTSTNPDERNFAPNMALIGLGLPEEDFPGQIEVPGGYGVVLAESAQSADPFYEPFGPGSYHQISKLDMSSPQTGMYYVAVYDTNSGGHYSLAIGYREVFSLMERVAMPFRLISVYTWAGQGIAFILAPMVLALLAGLLLVWRTHKRTAFHSLAALAGMLFIGSSATMLSQIAFNAMRVTLGWEVFISLIFALIPAILGVATLRLSAGQAGILQRIALAVIGTLALLAGSGLIVGPLLAIAASITFSGKFRN